MLKFATLACISVICNITLFGQSPFSWVAGQEALTIRNQIWIRNLKSDKFELLKKHSPFPLPVNSGKIAASWDGNNLYIIETIKKKKIRLRHAFNLNSETGPHWFWRENIDLIGSYNCLAVSNKKAILIQDDILNKDQIAISRLILWDIEDGSVKNLFERENFHGATLASAVLVENVFVVMLNDGTILEVDPDLQILRELKSNFWPEISNSYITSTVNPKGEPIYFQPHFRGSAFFDSSGAIYFPLQVREKNHWDSMALSTYWDNLKQNERDWAIANGKWPVKEGSFDGSDDVAVILRFDKEKRLTKIPESDFSAFLEQDKYTHQWRWSANQAFSIIGTNAYGKIVPIESLLDEEAGKTLILEDSPGNDKEMKGGLDQPTPSKDVAPKQKNIVGSKTFSE